MPSVGAFDLRKKNVTNNRYVTENVLMLIIKVINSIIVYYFYDVNVLYRTFAPGPVL